jgi:serum/glucocorticoid-regulated kinase 2
MILYAKTVGYDHMVDWWALGIVIHEMASCQLPFDDENHQQLYRKVLWGLHRLPLLLSHIIALPQIVYDNPVYPFYFTDELVDLMEGLLTKDPAQRLGQSADDLKNHQVC